MYDVLIFLTTQPVIQLFVAEPAGLLSHMSMSHGMTRQGWTGHSTPGFAVGILWHSGEVLLFVEGCTPLVMISLFSILMCLFLIFSCLFHYQKCVHFVQVGKWFILQLVMLPRKYWGESLIRKSRASIRGALILLTPALE